MLITNVLTLGVLVEDMLSLCGESRQTCIARVDKKRRNVMLLLPKIDDVAVHLPTVHARVPKKNEPKAWRHLSFHGDVDRDFRRCHNCGPGLQLMNC